MPRLPVAGTAFSMRLRDGRYGVCRVIRHTTAAENDDGGPYALVAASPWVGPKAPRDLSLPALRSILNLSFDGWQEHPQPSTAWVSGAPPSNYRRIGMLKPSPHELKLKFGGASDGDWHFSFQLEAQLKWDANPKNRASPKQRSNAIIHIEPFPPLKPIEGGEEGWDGKLLVRAWKGYQSRLGPYGKVSSRNPSDGTCFLSVSENGTEAPSVAQIAACDYLLEHQDAIRDVVIRTLFKTYPKMRRAACLDDDVMPALAKAAELKRMIGLHRVHILDTERDGYADYGFEFGCTWEPEHGLGVMLHKKRVRVIADAEAAWTGWLARRAEANGVVFVAPR